MYKKILLSLSILYLTGCTVAKPVVLNASYKQLNQVKKAFTQSGSRNGLTDIEFARVSSQGYEISANERLSYGFEIYVTPFTNQTSLSYFVNDQSFGSYMSYTSSLPFQTKASIRLTYTNTQTSTTETYTETVTMMTNREVKNQRVFNMYHLPTDLEDWGQTGNIIYSYIYNNSLSCFYKDDFAITINPLSYIQETYRNTIYNGQIYYSRTETKNIGNELNGGLQDLYLWDIQSVGALNLTPLYNISNGNYPNLQNNEETIKTAIKSALGTTQPLQTATFSYRYNAAFSEELTAFMDGYNLGIEEGTSGVGTTWVQQVFRAIQSFLDIDFGFFKLAHVLGGMLVIAIVIFVVRWFR